MPGPGVRLSMLLPSGAIAVCSGRPVPQAACCDRSSIGVVAILSLTPFSEVVMPPERLLTIGFAIELFEPCVGGSGLFRFACACYGGLPIRPLEFYLLLPLLALPASSNFCDR